MIGRQSSREARRKALKIGRTGEWLASMALRAKGYRIVARNFRTKMGEIDIVARRGDLIVFVEVKARPSTSQALDAVSFEAQRRISNAAELWIARQKDAAKLSWRFDVVAVRPGRWPVHFEDAF